MDISAFSNNIWCVYQDQTFKGANMGTRMTVVKLPDGRLWIHSPLFPDAELQSTLQSLGEVAHVIAPNRMHHLYLEAFCRQYPDAASYGVPGLAKKLLRLYPAFTLGNELSNTPPAAWQGVFEQTLIEGLPGFQEVAFLHKPSKTLLLTDALYSLARVKPSLLRYTCQALHLDKPRGLFAERFIPMQKDEDKLTASLQRILQWDFDNIILAHGDNISGHAKPVLQHAYRRYLS